MWPFKKKKTIELSEYLKGTKKVVINGVRFELKRISMDDHMAGLNVILKFRDVYQKKEAKLDNVADDIKTLKKFMRDIIYAGVARPVLTMKDPPGDAIHIDEVLNDLDLSQKLCMEILNYTNEKKSF